MKFKGMVYKNGSQARRKKAAKELWTNEEQHTVGR